jgi:hypothetical protein
VIRDFGLKSFDGWLRAETGKCSGLSPGQDFIVQYPKGTTTGLNVVFYAFGYGT